MRAAARGDPKALKRFFAISKEVDGAAAESHAGAPTVVYHLLGDAKFAAFLKAQPVEYWTMVRNSIASAANIPYLRRHFPETVKVLFRREIVDWPSPNGRYAIRKVSSDEFDLTDSKVVRAAAFLIAITVPRFPRSGIDVKSKVCDDASLGLVS